MDSRPSLARRARRLGLALLLVLVAGCGWLKDSSDTRGHAGAREVPQALNTTDPRWIYQATPHKRIAVVFIHGIFGDTLGTWTNDQGETFFEYLKLSDVGDQVDVFAFGFTTKMFEDGSLSINEAATKLERQLAYYKVTDYESIVFVAHSMGGLITMKMVSNHPEWTTRIPLLVFYGTPQSGAQISRIADWLISNPALKQMYPASSNTYIQDLNEDWVRVRAGPTPPKLVCGYEKLATRGMLIVPWNEATKFCDQVADAIADTDHISIVKPDRPTHDAVVLLVSAIHDYVLPRLADTSWETPEIRSEAGQWIYTLTDINAPNGATIRNRSQLVQQFSAQAMDPYRMMLLPQEPRSIAGGGQDLIQMLPIRDLQATYRIKLKLGSAPERIVVARIENLPAALAARSERANAVVARVNASFRDPQALAAFNALSESQQHEQLAQLAQSALAPQTAELPGNAKLLVAADTLTDLGWNESAALTLRTTESRYPDTAKTPSARHLAGIVAAQSGKPAVFKTIPTPQVRLEPANEQSHLRLDATDRETWKQLAERMQEVPAMQSEGLVLKGDVLRAQGDAVGAKHAYERAIQLESSPLLDAKLKAQTQRVNAGQ